jgi:PAS domain S-box-containing protein
MGDWLEKLFSTDFMPRGHCYLWTPSLVWLHAISNGAIGLAYLSISFTLAYIVHRIRDIPFQRMYLAFGVFIITCGFTHFMDVWVIWSPHYWLDGAIRAITAIASVGTAAVLIRLVPKGVALAHAARTAQERGIELEQLNKDLSALYAKTRETLAEAIPQLVWTTGPNGSVEYFNQRWCEYTGEEPAPDGSFLVFVHPEDRERASLRWQASLASGEPFEVELRLRRKDGAYRWFLSRSRPLRDDRGVVVRWFGTSTDIHDQKLAAEEREHMLERAEEMVRARDVFLAIAAHELKTPLTPLRLEIERILAAARTGRLDRLTPDWLSQRFSTVQRQIVRLEDLVAALLDVSRIAGGTLDLEIEAVDLSEVVREVTYRHKTDIERSGSKIELELAPSVIGSWDRLRLGQVVTNLLTNALRYGQGKPIRIAVEAFADRARLVVSDQGIGIAAEDQARLFERFERASSERHYGGLGLGLWIVREVLDALGGTITLESAPGAGATFVVELPRRKDAGIRQEGQKAA